MEFVRELLFRLACWLFADMFALLYDKAGNFVDCIFYKHPEDASGSFSLNQKTNSLSIDLEAVPDTCHTIVLAAAVYTTGLSLMGRQHAIQLRNNAAFLALVLLGALLYERVCT